MGLKCRYTLTASEPPTAFEFSKRQEAHRTYHLFVTRALFLQQLLQYLGGAEFLIHHKTPFVRAFLTQVKLNDLILQHLLIKDGSRSVLAIIT
jgi:hypothetical protein